MNPWTALLESFHSSLIDELVARLPKEKPELGMPFRHSEWRLPPQTDARFLITEVTIDGSRGLALLGLEPALEPHLCSIEELWRAMLQRAGGEFSRRGVQPIFHRPVPLGHGNTELPAGSPIPARVVWIPFRLLTHALFLGLAV